MPESNQILAFLKQVGALVPPSPSTELTAAIEAVNASVEGMLTATPIPAPPTGTSAQTLCAAPPDEVIAMACAQRVLDTATATDTYNTTVMTSQTGLVTAQGTWAVALRAYELAMTQAEITYKDAVTSAVNAFLSKQNPDSNSRNFKLYSQMQEQIATAAIAYEGSVSTAASSLGTAAGSLVSAWVTALAQTGTGYAQRASDVASAQIKFWTTVENDLDGQ